MDGSSRRPRPRCCPRALPRSPSFPLRNVPCCLGLPSDHRLASATASEIGARRFRSVVGFCGAAIGTASSSAESSDSGAVRNVGPRRSSFCCGFRLVPGRSPFPVQRVRKQCVGCRSRVRPWLGVAQCRENGREHGSAARGVAVRSVVARAFRSEPENPHRVEIESPDFGRSRTCPVDPTESPDESAARHDFRRGCRSPDTAGPSAGRPGIRAFEPGRSFRTENCLLA